MGIILAHCNIKVNSSIDVYKIACYGFVGAHKGELRLSTTFEAFCLALRADVPALSERSLGSRD